jgi:hypothetical protein
MFLISSQKNEQLLEAQFLQVPMKCPSAPALSQLRSLSAFGDSEKCWLATQSKSNRSPS